MNEKPNDSHFCVLVHGGWREEEFAPCEGSCGAGVKTRKKYCDNPSPSIGGRKCECNMPIGENEIERYCDGMTATLDSNNCDDQLCKMHYI